MNDDFAFNTAIFLLVSAAIALILAIAVLITNASYVSEGDVLYVDSGEELPINENEAFSFVIFENKSGEYSIFSDGSWYPNNSTIEYRDRVFEVYVLKEDIAFVKVIKAPNSYDFLVLVIIGLTLAITSFIIKWRYDNE